MHQHGGDIYVNSNKIDFSTNINLMGMPKKVKKEAYIGVDLSENYPEHTCLELRKELSVHENIDMENIICGNGAADLIFSVVNSIKPEKALLIAPSFFEYEKALKAMNCEIEYFYVFEKDGFSIKNNLIERITKDLDVIFLCNPNNPTGTLITKEFIKEILVKCEEVDVMLILDECFMEFVENNSLFSGKEYCKNSNNLFILKAFTKLYAMPGLRLGYGLCSNKSLIEKMYSSTQHWSISIPAQRAGIAALKEKKFVLDSLKILKKEKNYLVNELKKMEFTIFESAGNYIFFKLSKGNEKIDFYNECLKRGFLIRDCSNYEGLEKGYYRIAVKKRKFNRKFIKNLKDSFLDTHTLK